MHVALTRRRARRGMRIVDTRPAPIERTAGAGRRLADDLIAGLCIVGLVYIAADALAAALTAWGAP